MRKTLFRLRAVLALLVLSGGPPAVAAQKSTEEKWWECYDFFRMDGVTPSLSGRLVRTMTLEGRRLGDNYEMWSPDLRIRWRVEEGISRTVRTVGSISIEFPPIPLETGHGIYGYLFGDDKLVATATILAPDFARRGHSATSVSFHDGEIGVLARYDVWTLVGLRDDGVEVFRRRLAVPNRAGWQEAYLRHRGAVEQAWRERDPKRSVSDDASTLPFPVCLMSTPQARERIEMSEMEVR